MARTAFVALIFFLLTNQAVYCGSVFDGSALTREDLLGYLSTSLPSVLCAPDRYMRRCFSVNEDECLDMVARAYKVCAGKIAAEMPGLIATQDEGNKWSGEIGDCVGRAYGLAFKNKFVSSDGCRDYH